MRIKEPMVLSLCLTAPVLADGTGEQFSFLDRFALGEHTFADVQRRLGPASVTESGDAGAYRATMCFIVSGELVIHFEAGPLGGSEHHLGGFDIEKAGSQSSLGECARSQVALDTTVGGLTLGMTSDAFRRVVDPLSQSPSDTSRFMFQHKQMINRLEYDVVIHVEASFEDGRMVRLRVRKTETY
jgi:hypothetical protein